MKYISVILFLGILFGQGKTFTFTEKEILGFLFNKLAIKPKIANKKGKTIKGCLSFSRLYLFRYNKFNYK